MNSVSIETAVSVDVNDLPPHVQCLFDGHVDELSVIERRALHALLSEYADVFAKHKTDLGRTTWVKHHIETGDETAVQASAIPSAANEI